MARKSRPARKQAQRRRRQAKASRPNNESLKQLRDWLLPDDSIFSKIKFHGNIKWTPLWLVWLALCWAWSNAPHLTDAFTEAVGSCQRMLGGAPLTTYQGFMGAMVTWTGTFMPLLRSLVQERMAQLGSKFWCIDGWVPIAFDG